MTMEQVETLTPNGREIRFDDATGLYFVQPHNDNYWIECRSAAEAMYRYHYPSGDVSARQVAEMIVATWESQESIDLTALRGVSGEDRGSASEHGEMAAAIVAEIESICHERASEMAADRGWSA
jgi:hypothetical protein